MKMQLNPKYENKNKQTIKPEDMIKLTALLYFREALIKERFEECPELIRTAKKYGADQRHIRAVIKSTVRGNKGGRNRVAVQKGRTRPCF